MGSEMCIRDSAWAAREHPTISFRPVVRSVCPPAKSRCSQNHRAGRPVPFVCEVLRIAHTRPTIARKFRAPPATGPQFGAAINRSIIAERTSAHHGSLRNHGQGARLHG